MDKARYSLAIGALFFLFSYSHAQNDEWELHKIERQRQQRLDKRDSMMLQLENRWKISLSYGNWFFGPNTKSENDELFFLPARLDSWQLGASWQIQEQWSIDLSLGVQQKRDLPSRTDFLPAVAGNDIELEGSGAALIPLDAGVSYYFSRQRFRPFVGIGGGLILARSQYILAEGNLTDGITTTETQVGDQALLGNVSSGFDYILGRSSSFGLNLTYYLSETFNQPIGGYKSYGGIVIHATFSIIFGSGGKKR